MLAARAKDEQKDQSAKDRQSLTTRERFVWSTIISRISALTDTPEEEFNITRFSDISNSFKAYLNATVDPRINPGILWPSPAEETELKSQPEMSQELQKYIEVAFPIEQKPQPELHGYEITETDLAEVALALIKAGEVFTICLDGQNVPFNIPDKVLKNAREYLRYYREEITSIDVNPAALKEMKIRFSDIESSLEYLEELHRDDIREVIYWLEDQKDFIFEILKKLPVRGHKKEKIFITSDQLEDTGTFLQLSNLKLSEPSIEEMSDKQEGEQFGESTEEDAQPKATSYDESENSFNDGGIPKGYVIEAKIPNIRQEITKSLQIAANAAKHDRNYSPTQVEGLGLGISVKEIVLAARDGFVRQKKGKIDLSLTDISIMLTKQALGKRSLNPRMKKELTKITQEELIKLKVQEEIG